MSRIFLVEDDLSLINGLSFAVEKQGYALELARTCEEARKMWSEERFDLVILDVTLPDGTGFELCKTIRQTSKVPIIFLTAAVIAVYAPSKRLRKMAITETMNEL